MCVVLTPVLVAGDSGGLDKCGSGPFPLYFQTFQHSAKAMKKFWAHRHGRFSSSFYLAACVQKQHHAVSHILQRNFLSKEAEHLALVAQNTLFPGHCLAYTVAVPLPMHRDIFIISFPSTLPHDDILDNNTKASEKQDRLAKDTWGVLTLLLMPGSFAALSLLNLFGNFPAQKGSACVHTCMGLAQQLEEKGFVDAVSLFCAEIATKVEIVKRTAPQFHISMHRDTRTWGTQGSLW